MASFKQWLEAQRNSDGSLTNPTGTANQAVDIAQDAMTKPKFADDLNAIQGARGNPSVMGRLLTKFSGQATRNFAGNPQALQATPIDVGRAVAGEMGMKVPGFKPLKALMMRRMMQKRMKRQ
jgi:hypothetical protein